MLLSQIGSNSDPDILVGEISNYLNSKGEKYFKRIIKLKSKGFIDSDKKINKSSLTKNVKPNNRNVKELYTNII